jgi:hypothetical protein
LWSGLERSTLAIDDTPTPRYGPHVQGAGIHHNLTPGLAGALHVYGHVFVVQGLLPTQKAWGTIALPLLYRLHVRQKELPRVVGRLRCDAAGSPHARSLSARVSARLAPSDTPAGACRRRAGRARDSGARPIAALEGGANALGVGVEAVEDVAWQLGGVGSVHSRTGQPVV